MNHQEHMQHHHNNEVSEYNIKNFLPLIIIFSIIITLTFLKAYITGIYTTQDTMIDFMSFFFIIFASFKIINLKGFAEAYSTYDIIAKYSLLYAKIYPFIELTLGVAYFFRFNLFIINWITLIIMSINALGVALELSKKRKIMCACLGTVFKIPMTYVTLFEDLLMVLMTLYMIIF